MMGSPITTEITLDTDLTHPVFNQVKGLWIGYPRDKGGISLAIYTTWWAATYLKATDILSWSCLVTGSQTHPRTRCKAR